MPEGPSVKRFQLLCTPFVGKAVNKVGGSTRQVDPGDLKMLTLWDAQVHGKNLFLAFGAPGDNSKSTSPEASEHGSTSQGKMASERSSFLPRQEGNESDGCDPQRCLQEEHEGDLPSLMDDVAGRPWEWLRFHFGLYGSIRASEFARAKNANKRGDWKDPIPRLVLYFDDGGFLVFYNCRIHRCSSPTAEPATDILSPEFDRERALDALCKATPVCHTLLDQSYFSGLGNRIKNEALYLAKIHPLSLGSLLTPSDLRSLLDHALQFSLEWLHSKLRGQRLRLQIYMKEKCPEGHEAKKGAFGPLDGLKRLTWWCPQCQPQVLPEDTGMPPVQCS
ncbi:endonuclease 8-like 2 [Elgaria multicarinata webbii]|uniref:endonuclease 8-like 2 n=1 Tax=Elgaria multicarinata webbii TaxID=159646 RepID=UPI002FCCDF00